MDKKSIPSVEEEINVLSAAERVTPSPAAHDMKTPPLRFQESPDWDDGVV